MRSLVALALLVFSAGCGRKEERPHVILISIDTLRADHLGCYGYKRPTSPHLDRLAASAVRFDTAYTPSPWTLPAHAAMLTGVHPHLMGFDGADASLPQSIPTLASELQRAGYETAAFVDSGPRGYVGAERGFARGFRLYEHTQPGKRRRQDLVAAVDAISAWLPKRSTERPLFLFVHTKSVHALPMVRPCTEEHCYPYDTGEPFRSRFLSPNASQRRWEEPEFGHGQAYLWSMNRALQSGRRQAAEFSPQDLKTLEDLYDAGIAFTDEHLGRLFEVFEGAGLLANSLVIVTSDHGEAFLERHTFMHQEVYEPLLRVPLLVRWPRQKGGRTVSQPVSIEDITPTVLAYLNLPADSRVTGVPLPPTVAATGPRTSRAFFAYYDFAPPFTYRAAALRMGDFKLVLHNFRRGGEPEFAELYNLATDPGEAHPIPASTAPGPELLRVLNAMRAPHPLTPGEHIRNDGSKTELRSLGYVG